MIPGTEAASIAKRELPKLTDERIRNLAVEEVELSEDGIHWYITVSYSTGDPLAGDKYKTFKINAETGEILAMKIRTIR